MPAKPALLAGDNPQIAKGYGDAKLAEFLDAVPDTGPGGWKNAACRRIDAIVSDAVPGVQKAVKWNTPMYAAPDAETRDHVFLSFHCTTGPLHHRLCEKIGFHRGADLSPPPPGASKHRTMRYLHVREGDDPGDRFADWVKQAAALPGEKM